MLCLLSNSIPSNRVKTSRAAQNRFFAIFIKIDPLDLDKKLDAHGGKGALQISGNPNGPHGTDLRCE